MNEQELRAVMYSAVAVAVKELSDAELAGLNLTVQLGGDPRDKPWYEKVKYLFDQDNGMKMHEETKAALVAVVLKRLNG